MQKYFLLAFFSALLLIPLGLNSAFAETWYPGEGLKVGDYYRYNVCFTDWHNCTQIELDFWIQNKTSDGSSYNLQFLAIDGSNIQKGTVTIGTVTPDPVSFSPNIADYANVYKNTIIWLDSFATSQSPKGFDVPAWGRTGSVGGQSVAPLNQEQVTIQAGTYKTWVIGWHKGVDNKIWVVPSMPFPVKGIVYTDVTSGQPPPQYVFELLETGNSKTPPEFLNRSSTAIAGGGTCPTDDTSAVHETKNTDTNTMIIEYRYSPAIPHQGCPVQLTMYFEKPYDPGQKFSSVQYDIYTIDDKGANLGSVATSLGRNVLFAPVGEDVRTLVINQPPPVTHYLINVVGLGAEDASPDTAYSGLIKIDVKTTPSLGPISNGTAPPPMQVSISIPSGSSKTDSGLTFNPNSTSATMGSTVTWTNNDNVPHTVTSGTPQAGPDNKFDSGLIKAGQTFSHTFTDIGTYNYFCQVHPWMTGSITIGAKVPEFPISAIMVMAIVVAVGVLFTRFRTNISNFKF